MTPPTERAPGLNEGTGGASASIDNGGSGGSRRRKPRAKSTSKSHQRNVTSGNSAKNTYDYLDEDGAPLFQVRRHGKDHDPPFTQHAWNDDGWTRRLGETRRVLYRLPQVIAAVKRGETVWLVEGEKDVHAAESQGVVATTSPGGAGKWQDEYAEALRGADVRIVFDQDDAGRRHALKAAASLRRVDAEVCFFRSKVVKKGADLSDHLDAGYTLNELMRKRPRDPDKTKATAAQPATKPDEDAPLPAALQLVLKKLETYGLTQSGTEQWEARCPAHDDRNASLSISRGDPRPVVAYCHAGCETRAIADALGIPYAEFSAVRAPRSGRRIWTPAELLAEDHRMKWLVQGLWPAGSYGVFGGVRKSLKTYAGMGVAVGVSAGLPVFGAFAVPQARPVRYYALEGGRAATIRRLERLARSYGVQLDEVPLTLVFESPPLLTDEFAENLREDLDEDPQLGLIVFDPLYMLHGGGDGAGNLYARAEKLKAISTATADAGVAAVVIDHFNKSGDGRGLDRLTQAGMGEWADSWLLLTHRGDPDVANGCFRLLMEVGSRQWGGREHDLDLNLGRFDDDALDHVGDIEWKVRPHVEQPRKPSGRDLAGDIIAVLHDHPKELTRTQVAEAVGGNRQQAFREFDKLELSGVIRMTREQRDEGGKQRDRDVWVIA